MDSYKIEVSNPKRYFDIKVSAQENIIDIISTEMYPIKSYTIISIVMITCLGCLNDQPGQLAHMDTGGCLHGIIQSPISRKKY